MSDKFNIPHYDTHPAYKKCPVAEVICRIDFPSILKIVTDVPSEFQDLVRWGFPKYSIETPALILPTPGQLDPDPVSLKNHQFVSENGLSKINITKDFFAYSTMKYPGWDTFKELFRTFYNTFSDIYHPSAVTRVGLKFTNFLSDSLLRKENKPLRAFIKVPFAGPFGALSFMEYPTTGFSGSCLLALENNSYAHVQYGIGTILVNSANMFYIDTDIFSKGHLPPDRFDDLLEQFHDKAYDIFRWVITEDLHEYFKS